MVTIYTKDWFRIVGSANDEHGVPNVTVVTNATIYFPDGEIKATDVKTVLVPLVNVSLICEGDV